MKNLNKQIINLARKYDTLAPIYLIAGALIGLIGQIIALFSKNVGDTFTLSGGIMFIYSIVAFVVVVIVAQYNPSILRKKQMTAINVVLNLILLALITPSINTVTFSIVTVSTVMAYAVIAFVIYLFTVITRY